MWQQQQVSDFTEKLVIFLSFFGFLCEKMCAYGILYMYVCMVSVVLLCVL